MQALQVFFPRKYSLDLIVPIMNIIVASKPVGGFVLDMDAYFNASLRDARQAGDHGEPMSRALSGHDHDSPTGADAVTIRAVEPRASMGCSNVTVPRRS